MGRSSPLALSTIAASILANSPSGGNCDSAIISEGSNLSDDESCGLSSTGDQQGAGVAINLGALTDNGGPTETMLPLSGSDAIDAANCTLSTAEDQRGAPRPQGTACDIGAVEVLFAETLALCVNNYTGAVSSPLSGQCAPTQQTLTETPSTFCINRYTGQVHYLGTGQCAPSLQTHLLPDDGALQTCVSRYTGGKPGG